jgi:hypothetical protein
MLRTAAAGLVLIAIAAAWSPVAAQNGSALLDVPAASGEWVLEIITRGGIMGQGAGDIVIASNGRIACTGTKPRCPAAIAAESLRLLRDQVRLAAVAPWQVLRDGSICSDCQTTTLVLTSRNADGTLTTTHAAWDPTTRARLSDDVVRVYDIAAQLAQPLTR